MSEHIKGQLEKMNQQVKELAAIYHGVASKSGISDNEFWVWYAMLALEGEHSQQDICETLSMPKQTVNSIISNLAKKGFVYQESVPGTRNRKIIRLSEEGKCFGESVVMRIYCAEQRALDRLSGEERSACISLLGKYISQLKEELYEEE